MLTYPSVFDHALKEFEANKAKLYRGGDGVTQIFSDQEHQERVNQLLERPKIALAALEKESAAAIAEAERDLLTEHLDPILSLSDSEAARAAALQGFVEDGVEAASLPELAQTLKAILVHGTKTGRVLYVRAAHKKLEQFKAEHRGGRWEDAAGISDCAEALAALKASLVDPKQGEKLSTARARIQEAYAAFQGAKVRMGQLDGSHAQHQGRVDSMYQSRF